MSSIIKSKYGPDKVALQVLVVIIIGAAIPGTYKTKFSDQNHLLNAQIMNKTILNAVLSIFFLFAITVQSYSQVPNFSLVGFATENRGTTGGAGGTEVTVTTFEELSLLLDESNSPFQKQKFGFQV